MVADLSALLCIKTRAVKQQTNFGLDGQLTLRMKLVVYDPPENLAFAGCFVPLVLIVTARQAATYIKRDLRRCPGRRFRELDPEPLILFLVDPQAVLRCHLPGEVRRESVGRVQIEDRLAANHAALLLGLPARLFVHGDPTLNRPQEIILLPPNHL